MEEGSLRVDANLSVRRPGAPLGTKQEIKNLNSFAAVERAATQLRDRQIALLEAGSQVELTTFSAASGDLRPMRSKEESHDYRYFAEPDLLPLELSQAGITPTAEQAHLPELPDSKRQRFARSYGIPAYDASVLSGTRELADYYESVVSAGSDPETAANWVMGSVLADANENGGQIRVAPNRVGSLIALVDSGKVSHQAAKKIFTEIAVNDEDPGAAAERLGLVQVGDSAKVEEWVDRVLEGAPRRRCSLSRRRNQAPRLFRRVGDESVERSG